MPVPRTRPSRSALRSISATRKDALASLRRRGLRRDSDSDNRFYRSEKGECVAVRQEQITSNPDGVKFSCRIGSRVLILALFGATLSGVASGQVTITEFPTPDTSPVLSPLEISLPVRMAICGLPTPLAGTSGGSLRTVSSPGSSPSRQPAAILLALHQARTATFGSPSSKTRSGRSPL
jgi:hypothetical protein